MSAHSSTIRWCRGGGELSRAAADHVAALLARKPAAVIALPTGQTPLGLYAELVARAAAKRLSAAQGRFFNLDDYLGLSADHPLSYARFLRERFLMPAGVPEVHIRLLQGDAVRIDAECRAYDAAIAETGGLDLAILGLGANGHIGFIEPGSAKARALGALRRGIADPKWPVTALLTHRNLTVLAAAELHSAAAEGVMAAH